MNTHPTHTQVGGWGLQPMIVPIGIGIGLLHFWVDCWMCFFWVHELEGVWWLFFVPKYFTYLGILGFIFIRIILGSETPKSPAQLWYKIHVFFGDHTYQSTGHKKSVATISDQRE